MSREANTTTEPLGEPSGLAGVVCEGVGGVIAGKYRVVRQLGAGGMGVVVEAEHLRSGARVALKLLPPGRQRDGALAARLRREAIALARLKSPHVVRLLDSAADESGAPYLALELLEGQTAAQRLAAAGPMPPAEVIALGLSLCDALAEAHAIGLLHRDIKPSNLFLSVAPGGNICPKLLDFGVAKVPDVPADEATLTGQQGLVGSARYASPEQLRDARGVDARSDLWSLGVTLFELLSGAHPFGDGSSSSLIAAIAADPPRPLSALAPSCPPALARVVMGCLAKSPAARPPSAVALRAALARAALGRGARPRLLPLLVAASAASAAALLSLATRAPLPPAIPASASAPIEIDEDPPAASIEVAPGPPASAPVVLRARPRVALLAASAPAASARGGARNEPPPAVSAASHPASSRPPGGDDFSGWHRK